MKVFGRFVLKHDVSTESNWYVTNRDGDKYHYLIGIGYDEHQNSSIYTFYFWRHRFMIGIAGWQRKAK